MRTPVQETITEQTIKRGYFVLSHSAQLKRIGIRAVIVAEVLILLSVLYNVGWYGYYALTREAKILQPLRALAVFAQNPLVLPQPIATQYGAVQNSGGVYDAYGIFQNQNQGWRADFDVVFSVNGQDQQSVHGFLFPSEKKALLLSGIATQSTPTITYHITNLLWKRLTQTELQTIAQRKNIVVTQSALLPAGASAYPGLRVDFSLKNSSAQNAFSFAVNVVVKNGDQIVAVQTVPVFSLKKDEEQSYEARWPFAVDGTSFDIYPDIDYLNDANFQTVY